MKKKELKKEIERLKILCISLRSDIQTMCSDGREFDKEIIKSKYKLLNDVENTMWQGCDNNVGGLPNGFYELLEYKNIPL